MFIPFNSSCETNFSACNDSLWSWVEKVKAGTYSFASVSVIAAPVGAVIASLAEFLLVRRTAAYVVILAIT